MTNGSGEHVSWATADTQVGTADGSWGSCSPTPLVRGISGAPRIRAVSVSLPEASGSGLAAYAVTAELDGACVGFGRRFWNLIGGGDVIAKLLRDRPIVEVVYEDRYLSTPLTLALLLEVLSELKHATEQADRWRSPSIEIRSMHLEARSPGAGRQAEQGRSRDRYRNRWSSEWSHEGLRDDALRQALNYCGMQGSVISLPRRDLVHGRRLTIRCDSGRDVGVWLDQGLSYWFQDRNEVHGPAGYFPAEGDLDEIAQHLAVPKCSVQGQLLPTFVFVDAAS